MEQKFISWLEEHLPNPPKTANVILGIGDDGAILRSRSCHQVVVADAVVDKVHFDLGQHDLALIGRKALAVNLSDIAAMGAIADNAIVSLVLPNSMTFEEAKKLFLGISDLAHKFGVAIVGGDTSRHRGPLMVSIAATGYLNPECKRPEGWRMDGAQVGDLLFTTGPLGGSIVGKHLDFEPRLKLAKSIQERVVVNAATDISDSLAIDLAHVLKKSNIGAVLELDKLPVSDAAQTLAASSDQTAVEHALYDGEDFELLLSMEPAQAEALLSDDDFEYELFEIGSITAAHSGKIVGSETQEVIKVRGYEH
jgi:thiamine-monophosphate kinase